MKWVSHMAIGGALTFVGSPLLLPVGVAGAVAPDAIELIAARLGRRLKHRGPTHYVAHWAAGLAVTGLVWDFQNVGWYFALGGLSHVLADSLTVQGVPLGWWSDRRFHLFGGRVRTGDAQEVFITLGVVAACVAATWLLRPGNAGFLPFFFDWPGLYAAGLIDAYEWKQNRLRWF